MIFHCTLGNMKKLTKSLISPEQSAKRGQSFYIFSYGPLSNDPQKNICQCGKNFIKILRSVFAHISNGWYC